VLASSRLGIPRTTPHGREPEAQARHGRQVFHGLPRPGGPDGHLRTLRGASKSGADWLLAAWSSRNHSAGRPVHATDAASDSLALEYRARRTQSCACPDTPIIDLWLRPTAFRRVVRLTGPRQMSAHFTISSPNRLNRPTPIQLRRGNPKKNAESRSIEIIGCRHAWLQIGYRFSRRLGRSSSRRPTTRTQPRSGAATRTPQRPYRRAARRPVPIRPSSARSRSSEPVRPREGRMLDRWPRPT